MTRALAIDPATGQPTVTRGALTQTDALAARVAARLRTERGSVPWSPDFGSNLHRVKKADATVEAAVRAEILRAIEPEVTAGRMRDVEVDVEVEGNHLRWELRYRTANGQDAQDRGRL